MPDAAVLDCSRCEGRFSQKNRRHHCHKCGGVFCGSCTEIRKLSDDAGSKTKQQLCVASWDRLLKGEGESDGGGADQAQKEKHEALLRSVRVANERVGDDEAWKAMPRDEQKRHILEALSSPERAPEPTPQPAPYASPGDAPQRATTGADTAAAAAPSSVQLSTAVLPGAIHSAEADLAELEKGACDAKKIAILRAEIDRVRDARGVASGSGAVVVDSRSSDFQSPAVPTLLKEDFEESNACCDIS